jgi:hypothetical protein
MSRTQLKLSLLEKTEPLPKAAATNDDIIDMNRLPLKMETWLHNFAQYG